MKKKISIILVMVMILFAFGTTLTLAQETSEENQEPVAEATEETVVEEDAETSEQEDPNSETDADSENIDQLVEAINENEELSKSERIILIEKLNSYQENLSVETMTSVVNKILDEEVDLGQGFVILRNLDQSVKNGVDQELALELIDSYQNEENPGQFSFQTALELRKLSREDPSEEKTAAFAEEIASIIAENGEIETSELKQLAASYRKEAREEERMERKNNRKQELNSASEAAFENSKNNAFKNSNKGKGNSNKSKAKGKSSNKSANSNANKNAKK